MIIFPSLDMDVNIVGIWGSSLATVFIFIGIIIGLIIYIIGNITKTRSTDTFVGGEFIEQYPDMRLSGTDFYNTIKEIGILKKVYYLAERKVFDIYDVGVKITFGVNKILSYLHNGVLSTYLAWCLLGTLILFFILLR